MKRVLKYIVWIYELSDGNKVEIAYNGNNEIEYIKPLFKPVGLVFYLNI